MKSNGKNLKVFMYESHDYMDMYPEKQLRTLASREDMDKFIAHMRETWSGGTVSAAHELTPIELFAQRQSRYWRGLQEQIDEMVLDCKQEFVDEYYFYVEHKDCSIASLQTAWHTQVHPEDTNVQYK